MDEAKLAWILLVVLATLAGVGSLIWGVATWSIRNRNEHIKILEVLVQNQEVLEKLDDVLSHPSETSFSVQSLKGELEQIRDELRRLGSH